ncbi:hypothetical protein GCM10025859_58040 [Alicyclobacillus fastidiosus]|nr:hypothetical protein GCM10025859_58040 [Alicyclobacillus fastidiosus]
MNVFACDERRNTKRQKGNRQDESLEHAFDVKIVFEFGRQVEHGTEDHKHADSAYGKNGD